MGDVWSKPTDMESSNKNYSGWSEQPLTQDRLLQIGTDYQWVHDIYGKIHEKEYVLQNLDMQFFPLQYIDGPKKDEDLVKELEKVILTGEKDCVIVHVDVLFSLNDPKPEYVLYCENKCYVQIRLDESIISILKNKTFSIFDANLESKHLRFYKKMKDDLLLMMGEKLYYNIIAYIEENGSDIIKDPFEKYGKHKDLKTYAQDIMDICTK